MPRMSFTFTEVSRSHPGVAVVTLNRPERMNAMAFDVMIPFRDALREIGRDNGVRVVVITGAGRGFCSGADQENPGTMPNMDGLTLPTIALRSMELLDDVIATIRRLHQPVIAAVNGAAIGGGFCLALAADIRVAAETAYFRAAGINNGLTAAELGTELPPAPGGRLVPGRRNHAHRPRRRRRRGRPDRPGLERRTPRRAADACFEMADRITPRAGPGSSSPNASCGPASSGQPPVPHGRRGHRTTLRAHHHPELRGVRGGPQGGPVARLQGLTSAGVLSGN